MGPKHENNQLGGGVPWGSVILKMYLKNGHLEVDVGRFHPTHQGEEDNQILFKYVFITCFMYDYMILINLNNLAIYS